MATKTAPKSNSLLMLEEQFASDVGKRTGLDPRVILAQVQVEGAYAPGGTGGLNFLNLKSATVSSLGVPSAGSTSAGFAQFSSLGQAENATVAEYKSPAIHIVPQVTPQGDINAIAASPWDEGHYGGGASLTNEFARLFGKAALTQPKAGTTEGFGGELGHILSFGQIPANQFGSPSAANLAGTVGAGAGAAGGALLGTFKDFFGISFTRVMEMLAGGVLILLGLVMIVLGGRGTPASQTARAVRTVTA